LEYIQRVQKTAEAEGRKPRWGELLPSMLLTLLLLQQGSGVAISQYMLEPNQFQQLAPGVTEDEPLSGH
jgi:hypothetical protein